MPPRCEIGQVSVVMAVLQPLDRSTGGERQAAVPVFLQDRLPQIAGGDQLHLLALLQLQLALGTVSARVWATLLPLSSLNQGSVARWVTNQFLPAVHGARLGWLFPGRDGRQTDPNGLDK